MDNGYVWLVLLILAWLGAIITAFVICPPVGCFLLLLSVGFIYLSINS